MSFIDNYVDLLILQYRDLPKAEATIKALVEPYKNIYDVMAQFETAFDVDLAVGKQLDIIGKIVGVNRLVPFTIPKKYFGFSDNPLSYPMGDKFLTVVSYPMKDKFEIPYTTGQLNDNDYRFFIKAKIIKNTVSAYMIRAKGNSLQNAIDFLFDSKAYIVDNKNMSLTIYIDSTFDFSLTPFINQLDIIPRPQGVDIKTVISYNTGDTFGFSDNANSKGFGDKFGTPINSYFANKIL